MIKQQEENQVHNQESKLWRNESILFFRLKMYNIYLLSKCHNFNLETHSFTLNVLHYYFERSCDHI